MACKFNATYSIHTKVLCKYVHLCRFPKCSGKFYRNVEKHMASPRTPHRKSYRVELNQHEDILWHFLWFWLHNASRSIRNNNTFWIITTNREVCAPATSAKYLRSVYSPIFVFILVAYEIKIVSNISRKAPIESFRQIIYFYLITIWCIWFGWAWIWPQLTWCPMRSFSTTKIRFA